MFRRRFPNRILPLAPTVFLWALLLTALPQASSAADDDRSRLALALQQIRARVEAASSVDGDSILLPVLVYGQDGYIQTLQINVPFGSAATDLYVKAHNISYQSKAEFRVNGNAWIPIDTLTAVPLYDEARFNGGIGAQPIVRAKIGTTDFIDGVNTIEFRFNMWPTPGGIPAAQGHGYRLLDIGVMDGGENRLEQVVFIDRDPAQWTIENSVGLAWDNPDSIAAGLTYLTEHIVPGTSVTCIDCHADNLDGLDLKLFNYEPLVILAACENRFGVGDPRCPSIVANVLSRDVTVELAGWPAGVAPADVGRPWSLPMQPCDGNDSRSAIEWMAGSAVNDYGLDCVLDHDDQMALEIGDTWNAADWHNVREQQISVMYQDVLKWYPRVHPNDGFTGFATDGNSPYAFYTGEFQTDIASAAMVNVEQGFDDLYAEGTQYAPVVNPQYQTGTTITSYDQWLASRLYFTLFEHDDFLTRNIELHPDAQTYAWPGVRSRPIFDVAPHIKLKQLTGDHGSRWGPSEEQASKYNNHAWYEQQVTVNAGHGTTTEFRPVDWKYHFQHTRNYQSGLTETCDASLQVAWRFARDYTFLVQNGYHSDDLSLRHLSLFWPFQGATDVHVSDKACGSPFKAFVDDTPARNGYAELFARAFMQLVLPKAVGSWACGGSFEFACPDYTPVLGNFGNGSEDLTDTFYTVTDLANEWGVRPTLVDSMAQWGESMWPNGNWEAYFIDNPAPTARIIATPADLFVTVDGSSSTDDGTIVSYDWDFGDGTTATGVTSSHTYLAAGSYTIQLTVTDDQALTDVTTTSVAVSVPPVADFTVTTTDLSVDVDASTSTDDDEIISYDWNFGDDSTATGVTASHTYLSAGTYTIQLIVYDDDGRSDTTITDVTVVQPPVAAFTFTTTDLTADVDAATSSDDGTIVGYDWNFGDDSTATGVTASHTYLAAGTYSVQLIVTDDAGATDTTTTDVTVIEPPAAAFTFTTTDLTADVDATTSTDDGTIVSYDWNFGDDSTATGVTASHTYLAAGTYSVQLVVTDDAGATDTTTSDVTVTAPNTPPVAAFTVTTTDLTVDVDGSTSADDGAIVSYDWNFGDDSTATGVTASHTYLAAGTYTVQLIATDDGGLSDTTTSDVTVVQPPAAAFTFTTTDLTADVDATTSTDDGTIVSYDWNFGDDSTATGVTASHTYLSGGTYSVQLVVTDDAGATDTTTSDVTVTAPNTPPVAAFTVTTTGLTVDVDGSTSADDGAIVSYDWNFGDDSTATGVTASHTYLAAGTYTVQLIATDDGGLSDTTTSDVTVVQPPAAAFTFTTTDLTADVDAATSTDDGTIVSYDWNFGDDSTATGVTASHTYLAAGTYSVQLVVTDDAGATDTTTSDVTVTAPNTPPVAAFTVTTTDLTVDVDGSTSADDGTIVSYDWNFGDDSTATGVTASHTYLAAGTYTVQLIATDDGGLSDTTTSDVTVVQPPVAAFTFTTTDLTADVDATTSTDDGTIVSYDWNFGDDSTATGVTASHTYLSGGTYSVQLVVTDDTGATDTTTSDVTVTAPNTPPVAAFTVTTTDLTADVDAATSSDDGTIVGYDWNFGDDSTATGVTASHTYLAAGTYTVQLIATDDGGLSDTTTSDVTVVQPPVAAFTFTTTDLTADVDATTSTDDGTIVSYDWNFGDDSTATGVTASHTYLSGGTYSVQLVVTDDAGATDTTTSDVTVTAPNTPPVAAFTVTTTGLTVDVDGSTSADDGTIVGYDWNFGDDSTATGVTASHTYLAAGTYTVQLIATDDGGLSDTTTSDVTVVQPPVAAFTFTTTDLTADVDATTSTDDGTIVSYDWNFGDDSTATGVTASHTYLAAGTYSVQLVVTDDAGATDTTTSDVTVTAPNTPPVAAFTVTTTGLTVDVDGSTSADDGTIVSYDWNFGDDSTATGVTASHTYLAAGTYTVQLIATDDGGLSDTTTSDVTVVQPPVAAFTFTTTDLTADVDATTSTDDGTIVSYDWNFGDDSTATGVTASHTYLAAGTYAVQLVVTDDVGLMDTTTTDVTVTAPNGPPVAAFTVTTTDLTADVDGSTSADDGTIASYDWNFGDDSTGTGVTASHTYLAAGTYTIQLIVTDDAGLMDTTTTDVTITAPNAPPVAAFAVTTTDLTADVDAATSTDDGTIASYDWNFGDDSTATGVTASHTYLAAGTYTIQLIVTDDGGLMDATTTDVTVTAPNGPPVAAFTVTTTDLTADVDAATSTDDGTIAAYDWNFGDDSTATGVTASHTYLAAGTYTIQLIVTDDGGLMDTTTTDVTVTAPNGPPVAAFTVTTTDLTADVDGSTSTDDGTIAAYAWNFGDDSTATGITASHTYLSAGTYTIQLIVTDDAGLMDTTTTDVTVVAPNAPPVASFTSAISNLTANFDASTSTDDGSIVSYDWEFGDATGGTGLTPGHTYADAGTYTVTLTVTDDGGLTDVTSSDVTVADGTGPFAESGGQVVIEAESYFEIFDRSGDAWTESTLDAGFSGDFSMRAEPDDGSQIASDVETTSPELSFEIDFTTTGTYYMWVRAYAADSKSRNTWVGVDGVVTGTKPLRTDDTGSWLWSQTLANNTNATHTISTAGVHTFHLWMAHDGANVDKILLTTDVDFVPIDLGPDESPRNGDNLPPSASYAATVTDFTVDLDASASSDDGSIVSYDWDFGDTSTGTGVTTSHTYVATGTYTVILTVTDNGGLTASDSQDVVISGPNAPPTAGFSFTATDLDVDFDGSGSTDDGTIVSYSWDFGDSASDTGVNVSHTYATSGTYTVELIVTDDGGLTDTASTDVTVTLPPTAAFTFNTTDLNVDVDASTSSDDGTIVSYDWDFGDTGTGTGVQTNHVYAAGGTYTITLTVTDDDGLTDITTDNVVISDGTGPFVESGGTVVMEAENYFANIPRGSHSWIEVTDVTDFSGAAAMKADPNIGTELRNSLQTSSPELSFDVDFTTTGTYYIWLRLYANAAQDNNVWSGIDGANTNRPIEGTTGVWGWTSLQANQTSATQVVGSAGLHTFHVWMAEDGAYVDKIVLTTDAGFTPTGHGPAESPRGTAGPQSNLQNGSGTYATLTHVEEALPTEFALENNYPNPFSARTNIRFVVPRTSSVQIDVFDLVGRLIGTPLPAIELSAGRYEIVWDATVISRDALPSGIYLYRMKADGFASVRRLVYVR